MIIIRSLNWRLLLMMFLFYPDINIYPESRYPYKYYVENVAVFSDISPDFSKAHGDHALLVWKYYSKIFGRTPGKRIEIYYTKDEKKYNKEMEKHPVITIKGGRSVTCGWYGDHRKWFIIPYTIPDFGTQLHEISHDFLYFTFPKSEDYPWFKEGSGMFFESGSFSRDGKLIVESPFPLYAGIFNELKVKNEIIPLAKLLRMKRIDFYTADPGKTYSGSLMFFYYLMKKHGLVMDGLFNRINSGNISDNDALIRYIIEETGESLEEMERNYKDF